MTDAALRIQHISGCSALFPTHHKNPLIVQRQWPIPIAEIYVLEL